MEKAIQLLNPSVDEDVEKVEVKTISVEDFEFDEDDVEVINQARQEF